ncbi:MULTISPECIES: hypothetical protein [Planktothrix]|jgi:hypothetical protein|uniref:Uncharacterized protein n=2 Tax=Planktothrix TaxID=54304 RepID=A0A4P6A0Y3_PLAAG|nr:MULTISPECIES: hypothetical protein [Planktothrix]CAD5909827.1 hypothetical protein NO108_00143 [Planktothrix rubescens]CAC5345340.1 conserved membrane hypothetical protein [Planktothrix rubescens NIVA-CYA 18]CAD5960419.1 hypothetical protein PCC7821_03125 [Planktothrix rubescens NIVA-CYA 18]CAH2573634.1 hypothetical protein PRNO82_03051 [Planktothrix rubescens]GDZ95661.1 hypothetical protein PA905_40910 [Planktothrix agardhii CCAP 1459/11A]
MIAKTTLNNWKNILIREFINLGIINLYLASSFSILVTLNSLALVKYGINGFNYGIEIMGALVLGKVILLSEKMPIVERYQDKPLIISVGYKSVLFTIIALFFNSIEHLIVGLFQHESLERILIEFKNQVSQIDLFYQILCLLIVFIPFFMMRELNKILGKGTLFNLFFNNRSLKVKEVASMPVQELLLQHGSDGHFH